MGVWSDGPCSLGDLSHARVAAYIGSWKIMANEEERVARAIAAGLKAGKGDGGGGAGDGKPKPGWDDVKPGHWKNDYLLLPACIPTVMPSRYLPRCLPVQAGDVWRKSMERPLSTCRCRNSAPRRFPSYGMCMF